MMICQKPARPAAPMLQLSSGSFGFGRWPKLLCIYLIAAQGGSVFALPAEADGFAGNPPGLLPTARGTAFAPLVGGACPELPSFVPTCEKAEGFGLCQDSPGGDSGVDTRYVQEACPYTCAASASGNRSAVAMATDLSKDIGGSARDLICDICSQPENRQLVCCQPTNLARRGRSMANQDCAAASRKWVFNSCQGLGDIAALQALQLGINVFVTPPMRIIMKENEPVRMQRCVLCRALTTITGYDVMWPETWTDITSNDNTFKAISVPGRHLTTCKGTHVNHLVFDACSLISGVDDRIYVDYIKITEIKLLGLHVRRPSADQTKRDRIRLRCSQKGPSDANLQVKLGE